MPLCLHDGRLLRMERAAMPSPDSLFTDPIKEGVIKLSNLADCGLVGKKGGAVAIYNLTDREQKADLCVADVFDLPEGDYLCMDVLAKKVLGMVSQKDGKASSTSAEISLDVSVDRNGFGLYLFLPFTSEYAVIGLMGKYVSFLGIEEIKMLPDGFFAVVKETGNFGFYTEKKVCSVRINGVDQTDLLEESDGIYQVKAREETGKMLVEVRFV